MSTKYRLRVPSRSKFLQDLEVVCTGARMIADTANYCDERLVEIQERHRSESDGDILLDHKEDFLLLLDEFLDE